MAAKHNFLRFGNLLLILFLQIQSATCESTLSALESTVTPTAVTTTANVQQCDFGTIDNLHYLECDCQGNEYFKGQVWPDNILDETSFVYRLTLRNCQLTNESYNIIRDFHYLTELEFFSCSGLVGIISKILYEENLLITLTIEDSDAGQWPDPFYIPTKEISSVDIVYNLEELNLINMSIKSMDDRLNTDFPGIKRLDLTKNNLAAGVPDIVGKWYLHEFRCQYCSMGEMPLNLPSSIEILILSHNQMNYIHERLDKLKMDQLSHLDLAYNEMAAFHHDFFAEITPKSSEDDDRGIVSMDFHHNKISKFSDRLIKDLARNRVEDGEIIVNFESNPLKCDCFMLTAQRSAVENDISLWGTCDRPERLRGVSLRHLSNQLAPLAECEVPHASHDSNALSVFGEVLLGVAVLALVILIGYFVIRKRNESDSGPNIVTNYRHVRMNDPTTMDAEPSFTIDDSNFDASLQAQGKPNELVF